MGKKLTSAEKRRRKKQRARADAADASVSSQPSSPSPPSPSSSPGISPPPTPRPSPHGAPFAAVPTAILTVNVVHDTLPTPIYIHPHSRRHPLYPKPLEWMSISSPDSLLRRAAAAPFARVPGPVPTDVIFGIANLPRDGGIRDFSGLRGTRPWRSVRRRQRRLRRPVRIREAKKHDDSAPAPVEPRADLGMPTRVQARQPDGSWATEPFYQPQHNGPDLPRGLEAVFRTLDSTNATVARTPTQRVAPVELLLPTPLVQPQHINIAGDIPYDPLPPPSLCPFPHDHVPPDLPVDTRHGVLNSEIAYACMLALPPPQQCVESIAEIVWHPELIDGRRVFPYDARLDAIRRMPADSLVFLSAIVKMIQADDAFEEVFKLGIAIFMDKVIDALDEMED